ncbi:MAG: hypothetical protein ACOC32_01395 [Nanoarchaeota archaeon]
MFIRQKIIYNQPYAYLVRTRWDKRSKKVKQKVSRYLGKIHNPDRIRNTAFSDYHDVDISSYLESADLKRIVADLVELEFHRHGFVKKSKYVMTNGILDVELDRLKKVFAMNEGFMNKHTVRDIFTYDKLLEEGTTRVPFKFAALFVNAGIDIDKELFIGLYEKLFSATLE